MEKFRIRSLLTKVRNKFTEIRARFNKLSFYIESVPRNPLIYSLKTIATLTTFLGAYYALTSVVEYRGGYVETNDGVRFYNAVIDHGKYVLGITLVFVSYFFNLLVSSVNDEHSEYLTKNVVRIIVNYTNGVVSTGTGFFINFQGHLLTCSHVLVGELRNLRQDPTFQTVVGNTEQERIQNYCQQSITSVQAQFLSGELLTLDLVEINAGYDIALLKSQTQSNKIRPLRIDFKAELKPGQAVTFAGFPTATGYLPQESPIALSAGTVSSFPENQIGGEKYEHVQVNSINLGGNSGGPLFIKGDNRVVGIVNGNMNWGSDNVAFVNAQSGVYQSSFRVPLGIAYITPFKLLKSKNAITFPKASLLVK